jgi:hypothetical protein
MTEPLIRTSPENRDSTEPEFITGIVALPVFELGEPDIRAAGARAGRYLDVIGKTDLGTLDAAEWRHFCGLMIATAFDHAVDRMKGRWAPPLGE